MLEIYGIKNCTTVKKALAWLDSHQVSYTFNDYKRPEVVSRLAPQWLADVGPELLINRRGTTWRKLDPATREPASKAGLIQLLTDNPSLIRRPVIMKDGKITSVGFDPETFATCYGK
jgi:Spx/MgsR family transcriptional regulator